MILVAPGQQKATCLDLAALFDRAREHYLTQFRAFVLRERAACVRGSPEVKFQIPPPNELFGDRWCADFVSNDGRVNAKYFKPEHVLEFERLAGTFNGAHLALNNLRWDGAVLNHDALIPDTAFAPWFERWFDIDETRHNEAAEFSEIIHSLVVDPSAVTIDLGSAPTAALWEMLELLSNAGATKIEIDWPPIIN